MEGTSNYRIVLSKFYAISFFELIVMRASGNMITDFLHILWFPRQIVPKEQTSTKFQNLNFLIFHLILRHFFYLSCISDCVIFVVCVCVVLDYIPTAGCNLTKLYNILSYNILMCTSYLISFFLRFSHLPIQVRVFLQLYHYFFLISCAAWAYSAFLICVLISKFSYFIISIFMQ